MRAMPETARCSLGYGIVCGLTFPLMISSTYLQAMTLSHGAGDSFGLMFFCAYALTLLACAAGGLASARTSTRPGAAIWPSSRNAFIAGTACAFAGNSLMLARQTGALDLGLPQTVAMAALIGLGLAVCEVYWLARISRLPEGAGQGPLRAVGTSYLAGCCIAAFIFAAPGTAELSGALAALALSVPLALGGGAEAETGSRLRADASKEGDPATCLSARSAFVRAALYLLVLSFVFGAVSQASVVAERGTSLIEAQALLGVALAGTLACAGARVAPRKAPGADVYWALLPLVAVTLALLPFIEAPAVVAVAVILVFAAYYLTGINLRVAAARLLRARPERGAADMCAALGAGAACVMGGVLLGAQALAGESPATGMAAVSIASLLALATSTSAARLLERRGEAAPADDEGGAAGGTGGAGGLRSLSRGARRKDVAEADESRAPKAAAPLSERASRESTAEQAGAGASPAEGFARSRGMTAREAEVARLLCQGRTRSHIAQALGISPNTVKGYISNVYQKAGAKDKQGLIDMVESWQAGQGRRG